MDVQIFNITIMFFRETKTKPNKGIEERKKTKKLSQKKRKKNRTKSSVTQKNEMRKNCEGKKLNHGPNKFYHVFKMNEKGS